MKNNSLRELEQTFQKMLLKDLNEVIGIIKPIYEKREDEEKLTLSTPKYKIKGNYKKYSGSLEMILETWHNRRKHNLD